MSDANGDASFVIPIGHPAIPGHFPGRPIVPGVLVLAQVVAALEARCGPIVLTAIPQAKFVAALLPGEPCTIRFTAVAERSAAFECRSGTRAVARGLLRFAPAPRGAR